MKKTTLKAIKEFINSGIAQDVTRAQELPSCYEKLFYSVGMYGISGGIYKDLNGNLYAITARNSNLFRIF